MRSRGPTPLDRAIFDEPLLRNHSLKTCGEFLCVAWRFLRDLCALPFKKDFQPYFFPFSLALGVPLPRHSWDGFLRIAVAVPTTSKEVDKGFRLFCVAARNYVD